MLIADTNAIRQFFEHVHGKSPSGWLIIWTRQDKATKALLLAEAGALDKAVTYCAEKATAFDVYAAVGLQSKRPTGAGRGMEQGVCALPALWADVDIAGASHKATALPPTEQDAQSFIDSVGIEPSIIVHSGFGLQPYWLFGEPQTMATDDERKRLKSLSTRFQMNLRLHANAHGWVLDPTADLCRVLRVPGTFNHKVDGDTRMVTAEYSDRTYHPDDLEDLVGGLEEPSPAGQVQKSQSLLPPANLQLILDGCRWMEHCSDDAGALTEPEWYRMLTVVARCEDAERWAHELSKAYPNYSTRETQRKLRQAGGKSAAPVTCRYVQTALGGEKLCEECRFRDHVKSPITIGRSQSAQDATGAGSSSLHGAAAPASVEPYTDLGNANRFVAHHRGQAAYCEAFGQWYLWDGKRWREDEKLEVVARAGELIRSLRPLAKEIKDKDQREAFLSHLHKSESHRSLNAMVALAKADRSVAHVPDDFDADRWLMTVENGTLDLRTGKLLAHNPAHLITKLAPVTYDPGATCPNWVAFLDMIMNGRPQLVEFLKRALGSCLTGITSDKAMFILYGAGGDNGKSTMVDVMQRLLGDYAMRTPVDTFLKKRDGAIPNDIARLKGARFVWSSESERRSRLSEALIKDMTGGDKLAARFMRGEFFEFEPEFKLWLATNHKPAVRGDAAIWRRLKLIPFDYIPKDRQKKRHEVMEMFQAELPGILNWAVEGCLEWQRDGLSVPEEVVAATQEYEAEQDTFAMFLDKKCIRTPGARTSSIELYQVYRTSSEDRGELPVSHKTFAAMMSERSFSKTKTKAGVIYLGIGLAGATRYDLPMQQAPAWQNSPICEEAEWAA